MRLHDRDGARSECALEMVAQRAGVPGKCSRTAQLPAPAGRASMQHERDQVDEGDSAEHRAASEAWWPVAIRPDLASGGGGGQGMPAPVQAKMEAAFATDFSHVRIHEGAQATAQGALAYTQGSDIHFALGQYRPDTVQGQELLGHELAHVVQQSQGRVRESAPGTGINDDAGLEREADELGARAARSQAVTPGTSAGGSVGGVRPAIQRKAASPAGGVIQRKLMVDPEDIVPPGKAGSEPVPLTVAVQDIIDEMCPEGGFVVAQDTGEVTATKDMLEWPGWPYPSMVTRAQLTSTPEGCKRMAAVLEDDNTTFIEYGYDRAAVRVHGGAEARDNGIESDTTMYIDPNLQGQYVINGRPVDVPLFVIFAHELFGHSLPMMKGTHAARAPGVPGGTPPDEVHAVAEERVIAAEHNKPRRPDDYKDGAKRKGAKQ